MKASIPAVRKSISVHYLSVAEIARHWEISERSVRSYCAQGRVPGAFLAGKRWNIPADAPKPTRLNAKQKSASPLLERLRMEKAARIKGGIYHKIQVELTYNSNHIEGSRLSLDQTRLIFETATVAAQTEPLHVDDIVETRNHFRAIDYVIDHAHEPLSEGMIKELHRILKSGTTDSETGWFAVGGYKQLPNEVGGRATTLPEHVEGEMKKLLKEYGLNSAHSLDDVIDFHARFERIHPFQDGNGRVGRLVIFKECLANGAAPFIITDDLKAFYYRGLSEWPLEKGCLTDACLAAQDRFKAVLDYFRIPFEEETELS